MDIRLRWESVSTAGLLSQSCRCLEISASACVQCVYARACVCVHGMELESCQNPTHTQNDSHKHKTCFTLHNESHTRSVWFANTKHHSQTNAFCFRNKYIMCYTYKETYFFNYKKISSNYKVKSFLILVHKTSTQNNYTTTEHWKLRVDLRGVPRTEV